MQVVTITPTTALPFAGNQQPGRDQQTQTEVSFAGLLASVVAMLGGNLSQGAMPVAMLNPDEQEPAALNLAGLPGGLEALVMGMPGTGNESLLSALAQAGTTQGQVPTALGGAAGVTAGVTAGGGESLISLLLAKTAANGLSAATGLEAVDKQGAASGLGVTTAGKIPETLGMMLPGTQLLSEEAQADSKPPQTGTVSGNLQPGNVVAAQAGMADSGKTVLGEMLTGGAKHPGRSVLAQVADAGEFSPGASKETITPPMVTTGTEGVLQQVSQPASTPGPLPGFQAVAAQIVQQARLMVTGKRSEMEIQLKPEHLGKLLLKLSVEDGLVTARFTVENPRVGQMIESNLSQLKQSLNDVGLKFHQANVDVGGQFFGGYRREDSHRFRNGSGAGAAVKAIRAAPEGVSVGTSRYRADAHVNLLV